MKTESLFLELGYTRKTWRAAKTRLFKKVCLADKDEIDPNEVVIILKTLSESSSKYKKAAAELLGNISDDGEKINKEKIKKSTAGKKWQQLADEDIQFSEIFYEDANKYIEKEMEENSKIKGYVQQTREDIMDSIKERYRILKRGLHMGENLFYRLSIYTFPETKKLAKLCYEIMVREDTI